MLRKLLRALGIFAYLGVLAVVFVATGYLAFSLFVRSGVTAAPELKGLDREEAQALIRDQGLQLEIADEPRYDNEVPAGHIVLQDPAPGDLVKRGSVVNVVTSLGRELVKVPDLGGTALQAAQVTLGSVGLSLGRTLNVYGTEGRPGTVVAQNPPAGSRVNRATAVELYLSLEARQATFLMPDLVYRRLSEVESYFQQRGFRLGSIKYEAYEGIAQGVVLRQHPLPGHPLRHHDVVSLVVTAGRREGV